MFCIYIIDETEVILRSSMSTKFFVWASNRWCEVDTANGRVTGWRERVQFVFVRRGRLQLARRGAVLRGLRALAAGRPHCVGTGPALSQRYSVAAHPRRRAAHCHHCHRHTTPSPIHQPTTACAHDTVPLRDTIRQDTEPRAQKRRRSHSKDDTTASQPANKVNKVTKVSQRLKCAQNRQMSMLNKVLGPSIDLLSASSDDDSVGRTRRPVKCNSMNITSDDSNTNNYKGEQTMKISNDNVHTSAKTIVVSDRSVRRITRLNGETHDNDIENNKVQPFKRPEGQTKVSQVKVKSITSLNEEVPLLIRSDMESQSQGEAFKEVIVDPSDVNALREWLVHNASSKTLLRFDEDDDFKRRLFYAINPLVCVERCPRITRLLRQQKDTSLRRFMSCLGLRSVPHHSGPVRRTTSAVRDKQRRVSNECDKENVISTVPSTTSTVSLSKRSKHKARTANTRSKEFGSQRHYNGVNSDSDERQTHRREESDDSYNTPIAALRQRLLGRGRGGDTNSDAASDKYKHNRLRENNRRGHGGNTSYSIMSSDKHLLHNNLAKVTSASETKRDVLHSDNSRLRSRSGVQNDQKEALTRGTSSDEQSNTTESRVKHNSKSNSLLSSNKQRSKAGRERNRKRTETDTSSGTTADGQRHDNVARRTSERRRRNEADVSQSDSSRLRLRSVAQRERNAEQEATSSDEGRHSDMTETESVKHTKGKSKSNRLSSDKQTKKVEVKKNAKQIERDRSSDTSSDDGSIGDITGTDRVHPIRGKEKNGNEQGHKLAETERRHTKKIQVVKRKDKSRLKLRGMAERQEGTKGNKAGEPSGSDGRSRRGGGTDGTGSTRGSSDKITRPETTFNSGVSKRPSAPSAREYSGREDRAIVGWLSAGRRAQAVNGNRLWRELQLCYGALSGTERTWQSLRNRYLRYILPSLEALALRPQHAARLRAAAHTGSLKSGRERRPSIFGDNNTRGASSRLPPRALTSPSPPTTPSPPAPSRPSTVLPSSSPSSPRVKTTSNARKHNNNNEEGVGGRLRYWEVGRGPLHEGVRRSPRYSDMSRQLVARDTQSTPSRGSPQPPTKGSQPPTKGPGPTTGPPAKPRTRKLYNPNALI